MQTGPLVPTYDARSEQLDPHCNAPPRLRIHPSLLSSSSLPRFFPSSIYIPAFPPSITRSVRTSSLRVESRSHSRLYPPHQPIQDQTEKIDRPRISCSLHGVRADRPPSIGILQYCRDCRDHRDCRVRQGLHIQLWQWPCVAPVIHRVGLGACRVAFEIGIACSSRDGIFVLAHSHILLSLCFHSKVVGEEGGLSLFYWMGDSCCCNRYITIIESVD